MSISLDYFEAIVTVRDSGISSSVTSGFEDILTGKIGSIYPYVAGRPTGSARKSLSMREWLYIALELRAKDAKTSVRKMADMILMGQDPPFSSVEVQFAKSQEKERRCHRLLSPEFELKMEKLSNRKGISLISLPSSLHDSPANGSPSEKISSQEESTEDSSPAGGVLIF